jgi:hypothetical protein
MTGCIGNKEISRINLQILQFFKFAISLENKVYSEADFQSA